MNRATSSLSACRRAPRWVLATALLVALAAGVAGSVHAQPSYTRTTFSDSYTPITTAGGATPILVAANDSTKSIALPFDFAFSGVPYTTSNYLAINANGFAFLSRTPVTQNLASQANNANLFSITTPNATLAPWYDDLMVAAMGANPAGQVLHQVQGSPGTRTLTVQWAGVSSFSSFEGGQPRTLDFQLILYEGSDVIEFRYGSVGVGPASTLESASIGIEDSLGGNGRYIDGVTGSSLTNHGMMTTKKWPTQFLRFTPGAPTPIAGGVYDVGSGMPYPTFNEAIADLNHRGVSGPVTLRLTDPVYDATPVGGVNVFPVLIGPISGASALNSILIQPASGIANFLHDGTPSGTCGNQVLTGAIDTRSEPIIGLVGADFVDVREFNMIGGTEADRGLLVIASSSTDGAQDNTFRGVSITLERANTASIGIQQRAVVAPLGTAGTNSRNRYQNLFIANVYAGVSLAGHPDWFDSDCEVSSFGGGSTTIGSPVPGNIGGGPIQTFGIRATHQSGIRIFRNTIRNVTGTGSGSTVDGILIDNVPGSRFTSGVCEVFGNEISGLRGTHMSNGRVSGIRVNLTGHSGSIARIYNNLVHDLSSLSVGIADRRVVGIIAQEAGGGTGAMYRIDYNSVRIDPDDVLCTNACFEIGTASDVEMHVRNNVFANFTSTQTAGAEHFAWVTPSSSAIGAAGSVSDYNVLHINNTANGYVGLSGAVRRPTLAEWQTVAGSDANSRSGNPQFVAADDLHIDPANPTPVESGGSTFGGSIPWALTDYDGDARHASTPDIGADEGAFMMLPSNDMAAAALVHPADGDAVVAGVSFEPRATFENAGDNALAGIPVRYQIQGPAPSLAIVYDQTDNIASLGSGVSATVTFPTTSIAAAGDYTMIATAELPGDVNVSNDQLTGDLEIAGPLSGDYPVGVAEPLPFNTLSNAVARLMLVGVSGPTRLLLTDPDYSSGESFPIVIGSIPGAGPAQTVTIKPDIGVTTTLGGSADGALIELDGTDYLTIDGSNAASGTSRDLTITNSLVSTGAAVIWGQTTLGGDPVTHVTIENCVLVGAGGTATLAGVGFAGVTISVGSSGNQNNDNTVENCEIRSTQYGVYMSGASSVNKNTGSIVRANQMNAAAPNNLTKGGVLIRFEDGPQIIDNRIGNISSPSGTAFGISLGLVSFSSSVFTGNDVANALVARNEIAGVASTDPAGASVAGIASARVTTGTTSFINNMVSGIFSLGTDPDVTVGILAGAGTGSNTRLLFNSVSMTGDRSPATSPSFAVAIGGSNPPVEMRNNIFHSTQTSSGGGDGYAIGLAYGSYSNLTSDDNDFFVTGPSLAVTNGLTNTPGGDQVDLSDWQSETGEDGGSISADPLFLSATDLHIQSGMSPVSNIGTPVAGVTTDLDGDLGNRPTTPDLGADEFGTYRLTANSSGNGAAVKVPDQPTYGSGDMVQVTANPDVGFHFTDWSGDIVSMDNPLDVTMNQDVTITANFEINSYPLSVLEVGDGTVDIVPDQPTYTHGTLVTLTANPGVSELFVGWSGDTSSSVNPLVVPMIAARNLTATFSNSVLKLNVQSLGAGSVDKDPDQASYTAGTQVTLTANPDPGQSFVGWAGDTVTATNPLIYNITRDMNVTAVFTNALDVVVIGSGSVDKAPDLVAYSPASTVDLTAHPDPGHAFVRWSGDTSTTNNPITLAMNDSRSIVAEFTTTLDVTIVGSGSVLKDPDQPNYQPGAAVELVAQPAVGWHFTGWSGDTTAVSDTLILTMSDDKAVTATFTINQYTLDVSVAGSGTVAKIPDQPTYAHGTMVTLDATPDPSHRFLNWGGDASGSDTTIMVTMDDNKVIDAIFSTRLDLSIVGDGDVMVTPDSTEYTPGTAVQLLAQPSVGHHFVGWTGDTSTAVNPIGVVMDDNVTLTATFAINQYTLDVSEIGEGLVTIDPEQAMYAHGDTVSLTVSPFLPHAFVGWSGDTTGTDSPIVLVMTENKSFIAQFTTTPEITIVGSGGVAKDPDQFVYQPTDTLELTATPDPGHVFVGWSGDTTTSGNPLRIVMSDSRRITANFTTTLTINIVGPGNVGKNPDQPTYFPGATVELTATADPGFRFSAWSGDTVSAANPLMLLMDDNKTVTATFVEDQPPMVTLVAPNGGEVYTAGFPYTIEWVASDNIGVASIDLELSRTGPTGPFETIATGLPNDSSYVWFATNGVTSDAYVRVTARDAAGNAASDVGDAPFDIVHPPLGAPDPAPSLTLELAPVWPNPARGRASIGFVLPADGFVRLTILDVQGRQVGRLAARIFEAGRHQIGWAGRSDRGLAPAGIYFVRLQTEGAQLVRRFTLVR